MYVHNVGVEMVCAVSCSTSTTYGHNGLRCRDNYNFLHVPDEMSDQAESWPTCCDKARRPCAPFRGSTWPYRQCLVLALKLPSNVVVVTCHFAFFMLAGSELATIRSTARFGRPAVSSEQHSCCLSRTLSNGQPL